MSPSASRTAWVGCAVVAVGLAVTAAVGLLPGLRFGYRAPGLHVAVETTAALVSMLVALLAAGRFRRGRQFSDLLLASAFALFSAVNLGFAAVPAALAGGPDVAATWGSIGGRVVGAVLLVAAGAVPARTVHTGGRRLVVGAMLVGLASAVALAAAAPALPAPVDPERSPVTGLPGLGGSPAVAVLQLVAAGLYTAFAVGFLRRRAADPLVAALGVGGLLAALSAVNYALFPSLFSDWVYLGDLFRLGFFLVILVGAVREISGYWSGLSRLAVLEERRRLARDLHDGLAQELAFIVRNTGRLVAEEAAVGRIRAAAERALSESRHAIQALSVTDRPLDEAVADAARHAARRGTVEVLLDLAPGLEVDVRGHDALVRITAEAVTNAVRHSGAATVRVELAGPPVRLQVLDDGRGFDPAAARPAGGFGLAGMRQRADGVGARFRVDAGPGRGTCVEVTL